MMKIMEIFIEITVNDINCKYYNNELIHRYSLNIKKGIFIFKSIYYISFFVK